MRKLHNEYYECLYHALIERKTLLLLWETRKRRVATEINRLVTVAASGDLRVSFQELHSKPNRMTLGTNRAEETGREAEADERGDTKKLKSRLNVNRSRPT